MSTRERIQRIREQTADTVKSFEQTFKEAERLAKANDKESLNALIADSGIPEEAFVDAFKRYNAAGGIVDFGAGRSLLQGLTFGFADEIEAALPSAVTGLEGDYEQRVGQIRAGQKAFEAAEPMTALGAEALGSIPSMVIPFAGGARAAQLASKAPSLMRGAGTAAGIGAAEGFVGGVGRGEGASDRLSRGAIEGGLGAATAGLAPPLIAGGARVFGGGRSPDTKAVDALSRAIPEEQMPRIQAEVEGRIARGETGAQMPETLTDIAGGAAQRELRGARGRSPEVSAEVDPMMRGRVETQAPRIEREIETGLGIRADESAELQDLVARQQREAADAYDNLRQQYQAVPVTGMRALFNSPAFRRNYDRVIQTMQNRAAAGQIDDSVLRQLEGKMSYDEFMEAIRRGDQVEVPFDFLERMKRRISSEAQVAKRSGDTETAGELGDLARSFTDQIDQLVPEYRQARNLFAGQAEVSDALEEGGKFLRQTPASVQSVLEKMTESEKRAYLTGAVGSLRNLIENTRDRADLVQKLVGTPANRKRIATLMGGEDSPAFRAFEDALRREARFVESRNVVTGGSQTAAFLKDIERSGMPIDQAVELLVNPTAVTNPSMIGQMFAAAVNFFSGPSGDVAGRVAQRLMTTDPQEQARILREIENRRRRAESTARNIQMTGVGAGTTAGQIPSLLDAGE